MQFSNVLLIVLCLLSGNIVSATRLIVKFVTRMQQIDQMEYLKMNLPCPCWEYLFRSQFSLQHLTDFAVIETSSTRNVSTYLLELELISSVHIDEPCNINSRKLMSTDTSFGHINWTQSDYFHPSSMSAALNKQGFSGYGVKVAVFDTGLSKNHPHFSEYERYDWTDEGTLDDFLGHGTFVSGVIGGKSYESCPGIAPDVELHIFRIFTKSQKAYTSWFLDAFNMAIFLGIDVLNLSIGGPDHMDFPFTSKIDEMAANGIIVVSAIGNDGPLWGSANNPADQSSVIGVGGWQSGNLVSRHSSRGMTTWEFPSGVGRMKPDLLAPSVKVVSSSHETPLGSCRVLSGTSVANPIVTGAVALLLSAADSSRSRKQLSNVAAMKQILMSSADQLVGDDSNPAPSICEQGAGLLNIDKAYEKVIQHVPHVSLWPSRLSNQPKDCPYLWPFCSQQLFVSSEPVLANITILNSVSRVGHILRIRWSEHSTEFGESDSVDEVTLPPIEDLLDQTRELDSPAHHLVTLRGAVLAVRVETNRIVWPWVGYLAVAITVNPSVNDYVGHVSGSLSILVGDGTGVAGSALHEASLTVSVSVTKRPPRERRVLWDVFHSLSYPSPYVPNDNSADTR
jgi:membrane-bound transcription factor site-1 protease